MGKVGIKAHTPYASWYRYTTRNLYALSLRRCGKEVSAPASNLEVMGSRVVAATIVGVCVFGRHLTAISPT